MSQITLSPGAMAVGLGVIVGGFLLWRGTKVAGQVADAAAGIVSGNNAITQNQTNADGEKVTAYEGQGIIGTLGAGFNSASGGWFASAGEALGGWVYDFKNPNNVAPANMIPEGYTMNQWGGIVPKTDSYTGSW